MKEPMNAELQRVFEDVLGSPEAPLGAKSRIRSGVRREVHRARRRRLVLGSIGVIAVATLCAVLVTRATLSDSARSSASLRSPTATPPVGAALGAGRFVFADGSSISVQAGSSVALLADDEEGTILRLSRGQILAHVESRLASRPFVVLADKVRVQVVGTLFEVAAHQEYGIRVRGYEGMVLVQGRGQERRVGAGQHWPTDVPALEVLSEQVLDALIGRKPEAVDSPEDSLDIPGTPNLTEKPVVSEPAAPTASEPPKNVPETAPPPSHISPAIRLQPTFGDARTLEREGNLKAALRTYRAIALANGPQAEDALFAIGRILRTKMAKSAQALKNFERYRKRYPEGRYAIAVDVHIIELLLEQERWGRIESEASRFLTAHANDARAVQFHIARALSRAASGHCERAAIDLREIPPGRIPSQVKDQCP